MRALLRGYAGTDLETRTNAARVICPFTGEPLAAVPALRPDVASRTHRRPTDSRRTFVELLDL